MKKTALILLAALMAAGCAEKACTPSAESPADYVTTEDVAKVNVLDGCFLELGRVFSE